MCRSHLIAENILLNVQRWRGNKKAPKHISRLRVGPDSDVRVVVAGAGASLDKARKYISGATVATNSAAVALASTGHKTGLCVSLEALPMDLSTTKGFVKYYGLDWSSHPSTFKWLEKNNQSVYTFWDGQPHSSAAFKCTEYEPLGYGSSAMTAAIELALTSLQAKNLTLVGCDLGHFGPTPYAKGAPWQKLRWKLMDGKLKFGGAPERDRLHGSHGVATIPRHRTYWDVPAVRGGTVPSTLELIDQRDWIAKRVKDTVPVSNASLGAHIENTKAVDLAPWYVAGVGAYPGGVIDFEAIAQSLLAEAHQAKLLTEHWTKSREFDVRCLFGGLPFVQLLACSDIMGLKRSGATRVAKLRGTYEILDAAAAKMIKVLG